MIINGGLLFLNGTGIKITNGASNPFWGIAETRVVNSTTGDALIDYVGSMETLKKQLNQHRLNLENLDNGDWVLMPHTANTPDHNFNKNPNH